MWQQFHGSNFKKFWWEGQMMAKTEMPFIFSINKCLLMWGLHYWSRSWKNLLFTTLRRSARITCLKCVCRIYLLTKFCQLWIMLKTIISNGKMRYNFNIGLVFRSFSLCIYLSKSMNIGMGTLTLGLWQIPFLY
jgi:hypothetical protein